jgi:DNA helicase IV
VKGLEFDQVILANLNAITDVNNVYVALTRPRKSITIIGESASITLT